VAQVFLLGIHLSIARDEDDLRLRSEHWVAERELVVVGDQHPVVRRGVRGGRPGWRGRAPRWHGLGGLEASPRAWRRGVLPDRLVRGRCAAAARHATARRARSR
jgi:hypothetical protein